MEREGGAPDPPGTPPAMAPLCRHWARKGRCDYGDRCRFRHERVPSDDPPSTSGGVEEGDATADGTGYRPQQPQNQREGATRFGRRHHARNRNKAGDFRRWLVDTFGFDTLSSAEGILDVAGGKGELAFIGADGVLRGEVAKREGGIAQLQMAPDGSAAAVGTQEGKVAVIGADGVLRGEVAKLEGGISQLQMAPDGSAAAVGTDAGAVAIFFRLCESGMSIHHLKSASSTGFINTILQCDNDGTLLVFDSGDGVLVRCDWESAVQARFDTRRLLQASWSRDHRIEVLGDKLVFGSSLSSLYALHIDMLLKIHVECVTTIGPGRDQMTSLPLLQEQYGSRVRYGLAVFSLYTTATQVHSTGLVLRMTIHPIVAGARCP